MGNVINAEIERAKGAETSLNNKIQWKHIDSKFAGYDNRTIIKNTDFSELYMEVYPNNDSTYTIPFYYVPSAANAMKSDPKYLVGGVGRPSGLDSYGAYIYVKNDGTNTTVLLQKCTKVNDDITEHSTIYIWGR